MHSPINNWSSLLRKYDLATLFVRCNKRFGSHARATIPHTGHVNNPVVHRPLAQPSHMTVTGEVYGTLSAYPLVLISINTKQSNTPYDHAY
jgi:hypothetical protein